jgi:hypothetical protein
MGKDHTGGSALLNLAVPETFAPQGVLGGANFASSTDNNVIGTPIILFRIPVAAGVSGDVDTQITTAAVRVIDAWLVKTVAAGGGAGSMQVQTAAAVAVTSTMSIDVADQTLVRPTTIDDASHNFAAGATIRIRRTRAASNAEDCVVYVMAVRT